MMRQGQCLNMIGLIEITFLWDMQILFGQRQKEPYMEANTLILTDL